MSLLLCFGEDVAHEGFQREKQPKEIKDDNGVFVELPFNEFIRIFFQQEKHTDYKPDAVLSLKQFYDEFYPKVTTNPFLARQMRLQFYRSLRFEMYDAVSGITAIENLTFGRRFREFLEETSISVLEALQIYLPSNYPFHPNVGKQIYSEARKEVVSWEWFCIPSEKPMIQLYLLRLTARSLPILYSDHFCASRVETKTSKLDEGQYRKRLDALFTLWLYYFGQYTEPENQLIWPFERRVLAEIAVTPGERAMKLFKMTDQIREERWKLFGRQIPADSTQYLELREIRNLAVGAETGEIGEIRGPIVAYAKAQVVNGVGKRWVDINRILKEYFEAYFSNRLDTPAGMQLRLEEVLTDLAELYQSSKVEKEKEELEKVARLVLETGFSLCREVRWPSEQEPLEAGDVVWLRLGQKLKPEPGDWPPDIRPSFYLSRVKVAESRKYIAEAWAKRKATWEKQQKEREEKHLRDLQEMREHEKAYKEQLEREALKEKATQE
jgi:hypothetical protein